MESIAKRYRGFQGKIHSWQILLRREGQATTFSGFLSMSFQRDTLVTSEQIRLLVAGKQDARLCIASQIHLCRAPVNSFSVNLMFEETPSSRRIFEATGRETGARMLN